MKKTQNATKEIGELDHREMEVSQSKGGASSSYPKNGSKI